MPSLALRVQSRRKEWITQMRALADFAFLFLFLIFAAIWLVCWAAFHIAGAFLHVLLGLAVVALLIHIFRRRPIG
jgi:putative effector of murein hydrolase